VHNVNGLWWKSHNVPLQPVTQYGQRIHGVGCRPLRPAGVRFGRLICITVGGWWAGTCIIAALTACIMAVSSACRTVPPRYQHCRSPWSRGHLGCRPVSRNVSQMSRRRLLPRWLGLESTTAVDAAAADSLMSSGTLPLSQQRVCNSV